MSIVLLAAFVFFIIGMKPHFKSFNDDYISREQTVCINGFFVLLVFMRHFEQYIEYEAFDYTYKDFSVWMNQLIVVSFLFYSGYGIMLSIMKKGDKYVNSILLRRFPRLLFHFMTAVLLYLIANICMGNELTAGKILLSFIGWDGLGNSNWYIFDTLVLYVLTFIGAKICRRKPGPTVVAVLLLTIAFVVALSFLRKRYWYSTCIVYPMGMIYAVVGSKLFASMKKHQWLYVLAVISAAYLVFAGDRTRYNIFSLEILVIGFVICMLLLTMKLKIGNPVLAFFGKYVFEIYILQRLPMIILKDVIQPKMLYFAVCFAVTIVISLVFHFLMGLVDKGFDKLEGRLKAGKIKN